MESYGALAVADLNDDQLPEILYGARYSADRSTLVGSLYADVNQTYLKKPIFSSFAPSVDHIVVGDLNGEGLVDLVSSHSSEGTIRRHIQYEGNFSNAPDGIELVFPSNSPNRLQLVDLSIKQDPLTFSIQSGYESDFFEMLTPKT